MTVIQGYRLKFLVISILLLLSLFPTFASATNIDERQRKNIEDIQDYFIRALQSDPSYQTTDATLDAFTELLLIFDS